MLVTSCDICNEEIKSLTWSNETIQADERDSNYEADLTRAFLLYLLTV